MAKTAEEYKKLIADCEKQQKQLAEECEKIRKDAEGTVEILSNREADKRKTEDQFARNCANRTWLYVLLGGGISLSGCILVMLYNMRHHLSFTQTFSYNAIPPLFLSIAVICFLTGSYLFFKKSNDTKKLTQEKSRAEEAYFAQKKIADGFFTAEGERKEKIARLSVEKERLKKELYQQFPEEQERENRRIQAEKEEALRTLQEREALNLKAAKDAEERQQRMLEGQKMFDYPQAYIMDGTFETEFEAYCKAAEYGCQDAQTRVVEIKLGIFYKSGVKPDVEEGERWALAYATAGNASLYELLGKAYLYGEGELIKNEEKGLKYLEKAASKGQQNAMIMAGICHYNGVGTEPDAEKSRLYFAKAAKQGNAQAIRIIDAMDNGQKLRF